MSSDLLAASPGVPDVVAARLSRRAVLPALATLAWLGSVMAAEPTRFTAAELRADQQFTSYAYAHEFGSGIYDVNGRTLQVYTLPFSWTVREAAENKFGWRLILPVTLGFLDFETSDVLSTGLPDSVDSAAFVPGIEATIRAGEHWTILPYVQGGASIADQSEVETRLLGTGLRAERSLRVAGFDGTYAGELSYSGVRYRGDLPNDDFVRLRNGIILDRSLGREWSGHDLRLAFFTYADVYLDPPTGPATGIDVPTVQFESGLVFDTRPKFEILGLPWPRIGLSYRFAGDISGVRLVIGAPF
jgi:hypothetical protein